VAKTVAKEIGRLWLRIIDRSFRDGKQDSPKSGACAGSRNWRAQQPPESPPGSIPDVDIDPVAGNLSEKFAQPLDSGR
jgi:hypothetical protein